MEGDAPPDVRAKALWAFGWMCLMLHQRGARAPLEASLELFRRLEDRRGEARALLLLGNQAMQRGERVAAVEMLAQSARLARETADHWCLCHSLALTGRALLGWGD